jgi:hypothetical protein
MVGMHHLWLLRSVLLQKKGPIDERTVSQTNQLKNNQMAFEKVK